MPTERAPADYYAHGLGPQTYDLLLNGAAVEGDIAFYADCAREFGAPVLELGCGTGRVLVALAERGVEITGVDRSAAMLAQAEARVRPHGVDPARVRLVKGDMTRFDIGQTFPLVIVPFRSFQHIVEASDQRAALKAIRRHLKPGGHVVIDLFDPRFDLLTGTASAAATVREVRDPQSGNNVRRTVVRRDVDFLAQIVHEAILIEVVDAVGQTLVREEVRWSLKWNTRQEMRYLFELCGFVPVAEYSDFRKSPPAYGKEQIWVARRLDT